MLETEGVSVARICKISMPMAWRDRVHANELLAYVSFVKVLEIRVIEVQTIHPIVAIHHTDRVLVFPALAAPISVEAHHRSLVV